MEQQRLKAIVEALIFVSDEPLSEQSILKALEQEGLEKKELRETLDAIRAAWNDDEACGLTLADIAGGYQFRTKESVAEWAKRLFAAKPVRLSQPSLETLAIIAYRQPITRSEIEHIRGVDCGGVLKTLLERRLVKVVGKRDEPGQPLIYGTAKDFLETFNLSSLQELPALTDLKDLARRREEDNSQAQIFGLTGTEGDGDDEEGDDQEEPTAVIRKDEDEEESTEVISRVEEENEEDREALESLEGSLKSLRRLERAIFPKPPPQTQPTEGEGDHVSQQGETAAAQPAEEGGPAETDRQDAPEPVDRTGE